MVSQSLSKITSPSLSLKKIKKESLNIQIAKVGKKKIDTITRGKTHLLGEGGLK